MKCIASIFYLALGAAVISGVPSQLNATEPSEPPTQEGSSDEPVNSSERYFVPTGI